jgi:hypothetical protein
MRDASHQPEEQSVSTTRGWQRELETDPGSEIARRVAREHRDAIQNDVHAWLAKGYALADAQRMAEITYRTRVTKAEGCDPCDCGRIAITWIRCRAIHYSAACCPQHRDAVLRCIADAKLDQKQWDAQPMNIDYWMRQGEAMAVTP